MICRNPRCLCNWCYSGNFSCTISSDSDYENTQQNLPAINRQPPKGSKISENRTNHKMQDARTDNSEGSTHFLTSIENLQWSHECHDTTKKKQPSILCTVISLAYRKYSGRNEICSHKCICQNKDDGFFDKMWCIPAICRLVITLFSFPFIPHCVSFPFFHCL